MTLIPSTTKKANGKRGWGGATHFLLFVRQSLPLFTQLARSLYDWGVGEVSRGPLRFTEENVGGVRLLRLAVVLDIPHVEIKLFAQRAARRVRLADRERRVRLDPSLEYGGILKMVRLGSLLQSL